MNATAEQIEPRPRPDYIPKIYEADATDEQRQLYADVCSDLAFDPETPEPIASEYRVMLSVRCGVPERMAVKGLAQTLGLTRNALILTALKLGIAALGEATAEREGSKSA